MGLICHTSRLVIREFTLADDVFILALLNSPGWLAYIGDRGVTTSAQARHFLAEGPLRNYRELGFGGYAVEEAQMGVTIGMCGLFQRDYLPKPDLGFAFLPEFQGQGYALESAQAVLAVAQEQLGFNPVYASVMSANQPSRRLLDRLGLVFDRVVISQPANETVLLYTTKPGTSPL